MNCLPSHLKQRQPKMHFSPLFGTHVDIYFISHYYRYNSNNKITQVSVSSQVLNTTESYQKVTVQS